MAWAQIASTVISTTVSAIAGSSNEKKNRELQEYLAKLDQEQTLKLEGMLIKAKSQAERERLLFEQMTLDKQNQHRKETSRQKMVGFIVVGVGLILLTSLIYFARKNKA